MDNNSMFTSYFSAYGLSVEKREDVKTTPEGLRAAAKVLEDKAKELDKPKLTARQEFILDKADELSISVVKLDGLDYSTIHLCDSIPMEQKRGDVSFYSDTAKEVLIYFTRRAFKDNHMYSLRYVTMVDSWGDLETFLVWE